MTGDRTARESRSESMRTPALAEREERSDDEARPRVQAVLEKLVPGSGTQHAASRGAGGLRGGLLAKEARNQGQLLQILPSRPDP